ncbi:MAG: hypothetical protein JSR54_11685 [Proteobacteria bacterium]|nr:hypothetical protein [Pseudomonadota bacterium]
MKNLIVKLFALLAMTFLVWAGGCGGDSSSGGTTPPPASSGVVGVGVITQFGSVYVTGLRFDVSAAQVLVNGVAAAESDLKVGQYVRVKGHSDGAQYHADVIRYDDVLEGPITSIDSALSSFVAMGQTVHVTSATTIDSAIAPASIAGLAVGQVVEVSGPVPAPGAAIDATRVGPRIGSGPYDVTGFVTGLDGTLHRFALNGLVVDFSTATLDGFSSGQPANGDLVLVKGSTFNLDGSLLAIRVEFRSDDWLTIATGNQLRVEGGISDFVSTVQFKVAGWPVTTSAATVYEHGTAANLANDVKVAVEGRADATGTLVAEKIRFQEVNTVRLVAPIERLTAASRSMQLFGLTVTTDDLTRFEDQTAMQLRSIGYADLAVGDWVDVRGYEDPAASNAVTATRVVRITAQDAVQLRGPFRTPAPPAFRILSATVLTTDATHFLLEEDVHLTADAFFEQAIGQIVEAWGAWDGTALTATRVEIKVADD